MSDERVPLAQAILLCDTVYKDPWTGKKTILGVLSSGGYAGAQFPTWAPVVTVYAVLTEVVAATTITVRIVDPNGNTVVQGETQLPAQDALAYVDGHCSFQNVMFSVPGEHTVEVIAGNTPLAWRRFPVRLRADAVR